MKRIKITSKDGLNRTWPNNTMVQIDGHEVPGVRSIGFETSVDKAPVFTIETIAAPEIEMGGDVLFEYHPRTIEEAARVLRRSCERGSENYNALVASIRSAVKEYHPNSDNVSLVAEAQSIANRILGIEN